MAHTVLSLNPAGSGNFPYGGHDPSAVIVQDGKIIAGVEQERISRNKHAVKEFPKGAITKCLEISNIIWDDIDLVTIPWNPKLYKKDVGNRFRAAFSEYRGVKLGFYIERTIENLLISQLLPYGTIPDKLAKLGDGVPPIETYSHHKCHAASAFYVSEFDRATVVTLDGKGEYDSTVIWEANTDKGLSREKTYKHPNSLGHFFGSITEFLGFRAQNGEGKTMGLAPYGSRNPEIESILREKLEFGYEYDMSPLIPPNGGSIQGSKTLERWFDQNPNPSTTEFSQWEKDLAATAQGLLEDTVLDIVRESVTKTGNSNVALSGGVALNCKMNSKVRELDCVDELYIQPVAHDGGTTIGAGLLPFSPEEVPYMDTTYFGPGFDSAAIKSRLEDSKLQFNKPEQLEQTVAEKIADGELIGWFNGRMEMGPRALGNRSILADPRTEASRDRVNEFVKHREGWRPFAPSMTVEAAKEYLEGGDESPFMIETYPTEPEHRDKIQAVIHPSDATTRPQTVTKNQNDRYYTLIKEFEEITGVPVLLNTSFNDHGEPIVATPSEAVRDFFVMGLDTLVLGDYLIKKE